MTTQCLLLGAFLDTLDVGVVLLFCDFWLGNSHDSFQGGASSVHSSSKLPFSSEGRSAVFLLCSMFILTGLVSRARLCVNFGERDGADGGEELLVTIIMRKGIVFAVPPLHSA
ncbi:1-(5-phosphoribosyl)-5-[(5-phosphoribosylamino) methylideneamino] imidazole-4-carboxamide isomerase [Striga asiatica]|uniref:1-(5-phosphoribosyl)-5-[(5-phosphoribosylamino) methylideneamino] imidazole-4-carboxamide isomerase n=1 Tax=Striga asiatica TaxID=4170 RepID=A0A5A7PIG3_STRAF|nr:1-(5-phosphoribosyl)-5-[(5-phosphoribosylamino) methylideneamino] imidazole-4-carboxamide isomerase [Striga asiatica]